ncbi:MAG: thiolase family protein [Alcaligenaceae bacterium]|nr:thiolase family protein [Alcaligenaceae bacterium SAGV5]MPS28409.1 thiolase family protein [Alcaligenaceae bacterium SAGV5]MPS51384.1 thiolase family protein [Alcaligenaceae bacterium SAGV3]MPT55952.1 thiolase family protein [Alcaligenaceae bacterium]
MRGKYVIAGIGHTRYGKLPGRSTVSLNVEACRNALADANVGKDIIDALFVKVPTSAREFMYGQKLAEAMGLRPKLGGAWDQGGAANVALISQAVMAIEAGQCEAALVCYADNPRTGNRAVYARPRGDDAVYGWFSTAAGYAMIQRRHMIEHGTRPEDLGAIAKACRRHGAANPNAQLRGAISLDDYMASPMQIDPLRRDDCCLVSDGGAAVVVMSAARARALGVPNAVPILGFGQGQTSWEVAQRPTLTSTEAVVSGRTAFAMAGLAPKDIDVAQIYDCFTITALMTLEDYGFCKKGEGGRFVADGRIEAGGDLPLNTSGGLLSETGMPGMQLVIEGVRQIRGQATLQVPGADTCLVSNQGGTMHTHSTLILGSQP